MLPNKLPFTDSPLGRTCISGSVRSCSRRRRQWRLLLVRNLSESHARHARIPSQTKERPYSARGSVPTSSSEFAADWTCGFARFRTLECPVGIPIPHFCARAGVLPIGKAEAATASQDPIEIKAFGTRPGRTCGSDRFRTSRKPLNVASVRARTCPKRKCMSKSAGVRSNYFPSSPASRKILRVTKFHTMTIAVAPIFVIR